jgi:hypothetical protein
MKMKMKIVLLLLAFFPPSCFAPSSKGKSKSSGPAAAPEPILQVEGRINKEQVEELLKPHTDTEHSSLAVSLELLSPESVEVVAFFWGEL